MEMLAQLQNRWWGILERWINNGKLRFRLAPTSASRLGSWAATQTSKPTGRARARHFSILKLQWMASGPGMALLWDSPGAPFQYSTLWWLSLETHTNCRLAFAIELRIHLAGSTRAKWINDSPYRAAIDSQMANGGLKTGNTQIKQWLYVAETCNFWSVIRDTLNWCIAIWAELYCRRILYFVGVAARTHY